MSAPRRENDAKRKVTFNTTDAGGHVRVRSWEDDLLPGPPSEMPSSEKTKAEMASLDAHRNARDAKWARVGAKPLTVKIDSRNDNSRGGK